MHSLHRVWHSCSRLWTLGDLSCRLCDRGAFRHLNMRRISLQEWRKIIIHALIASVLHEMYVPYEVEEFIEQYGPIIVDILMALPLVRLLRVYFIHSQNRTIAKVNCPSLLQLPEELILEILSAIHSLRCPTSRRDRTKCYGCSMSRNELVHLSMTNKHMRNICAPLIFTHVSIGGGYNYGWWRATRSLKVAQLSSHAKQYANSFMINVDPGYDMIRYPPKRFPRRLAITLSTYEMVRHLTIVIPDYSVTTFKESFEQCNLELPNVRTLVLGSHLQWVINMCPRVEVISIVSIHWLDEDTYPGRPCVFIHTVGKAPNLDHFEMHENWDVHLVETVLKCVPRIESLAMPGRNYCNQIHALLSVLPKFSNLKTLAPSGLANLGVGYKPSICGDAYVRPESDAMAARVAQRRHEAMFWVGRRVLEKMKGLDELWVGCCDGAVHSAMGNGHREIKWSRAYRQSLGETD